MTSTFPEAFGMVAAEAAACGTLPVVANHSGMGEVARTLRGRRAGGGARLAVLRGRSDVGGRARGRALGLAGGARRRCAPPPATAIVAETRARYSWDGVAGTVIAAARGELDDAADPELPRRREQR